MRSASWLYAVIAVVGLVGLASAADLYVPTEYGTIQEAINAASSTVHDVIHVAPGYYEENDAIWRDLHIDKSLDLIGAGSGSDPATATIVGLSAGKTNGVEIYGTGLSVRIEGITFTKRNPPATVASGFNIRAGEAASTFTSLVFEDVESAYATGRNVFIDGNGTYQDITVENCSFHHSGAWGFSLRGIVNACTIIDSDFEYNGTSDVEHGIGFDVDMPISIGRLDVTGGSFSHNKAKGVNLNSTTNATFTGIAADYNSGASGGGFGVCLWEWQGSSSSLAFTNSSFSHNATDGFLFGTDGTCTIAGVSISGCKANANGRGGVFMWMSASGPATDVHITDCDLSGNAGKGVAVYNNTVDVDASGNWWGSAAPATVAGKVTAHVDYTPWLGSGYDQGGNLPGFEGDFSSLWVGPNGPQTQVTGRIQEGVDRSVGSTVNVLAGNYPEQVVVGRALSLLGAGATTTTIDATGLSGPGNVVDLSPVSGNVTFDGFTVKAGAQLYTVRHSTPNALSVVTISHNHLIGHNQSSDDGYDFGVIGGYGSVGKVVVSANVFNSYYNNPILFERHKGLSEVVGNTIEIPDGADGIFYMTHSGDDVTPLQSIRANVLTHYTYDNTCGGIYVSSAYQTVVPRAGKFSDVEILGNTVYGVGANKRGIGMGNNCDTGGGSLGEIVSPRIRGNVVVGTGSPTNNRGLQLLGYITNADVSNNDFNNLQEGIRVWSGPYGGFCPVGTQIHYNSLANCSAYGINDMCDPLLAAEMNWWGSATGPTHSGNIGGTGSPSSDNVDYDPWLGKAPGGENIVCVPDPEYLTVATPTKTIAVRYLGGGEGLLYGYSLKFSWNGSIVTTAANKVHEGDLLYTVPHSTFFYASLTGTDEITVDCARLGAVDGVTGPGTMFTIEFTGTNVGTSPIDLTVLNVRDRYNNTLTGYFADDGTLIVDISKPVVTDVKIWNDTLVTDDYIKNGDLARLTATVTDDGPAIVRTSIWADLSGLGGLPAVNPDTYDSVTGAAVWNAWVATCDPADGEVTVTVDATDVIGNPAVQGRDTIIADNTAPAVVTGFDAAPAHEECVLAWTNGYDLNWAGVTVRRSGDGEYPTYPYLVANWPNVDAHYPATYALGIEVYNGTGTGVTDAVVPRDIYYYQAFCYDAAMNYGLAASTARDLATNYWLGDIAAIMGEWGGYDGRVNDTDINFLGGTYHVAGAVWPWNQCDVGPTVHPDYSRVGLPKPDNFVGFEDLMVFAMNYGVVVPRIVPLLPGSADEALALSLAEISSIGDEVQVAVRLDGNAGEVKGLSAAVAFAPTELEFVSARFTPEMQSPLAQVFFWAGCEDQSVILDLAILGTGVSIGGSGDVAVLTFRALTGEYALEFDEATLRGVENDELTATLDGCASRPGNPTAFRLVQNAPNPFNPKTTVAYEVPQSSRVEIRVYDVTGRAVRTLVDGTVEPGRYAVTWDGRNDAGEAVGSGVYFCTMQTPIYHATHKMVLMK